MQSGKEYLRATRNKELIFKITVWQWLGQKSSVSRWIITLSEQAQQSVKRSLIDVGSQGSITSNQNQISVKTQRKRLELKVKLIQHKTVMDIIEEQMELMNEEERIHQHDNDDQVS